MPLTPGKLSEVGDGLKCCRGKSRKWQKSWEIFILRFDDYYYWYQFCEISYFLFIYFLIYFNVAVFVLRWCTVIPLSSWTYTSYPTYIYHTHFMISTWCVFNTEIFPEFGSLLGAVAPQLHLTKLLHQICDTYTVHLLLFISHILNLFIDLMYIILVADV